MKLSTTTAVTTVKQQMKLREWAEQIEARRASGMTVQSWCAENGMNVKTYYYHLRKVREQCVESVPEIVPLTMPQQTGDIHIEKNGLQISLPADISKEILIALVQELC
ncbi:MAG: IS66 family insertion sequence element accessory protein TnpB [Oscillospiraceae bacterium]|nr:IS66 family insertion sequence element accessory protein TnpB [Oscillospiraceae bacterium]